MEVGTIRQINIDNEMQASYLDYAMSVIVSRALPDVRDGLKPVHRRILYAMYDLGLTSDKPYKKSARIVGEVLGKYHPHGDAAVYEAMVRMAQDFSLRYPLVDGQGNFGSIDGDNAAAMRYTEARLAPIANEMLADIDKDTVDWTDNFDGTLREPTVLPAALPNLLVNGSAGIAVGMATNIPPHNLGEVCDALAYMIDNYSRAEDIGTEDLMRFIQGPDFPTGGIVFRYEHVANGAEAEQVDAIEKAYGSGRGSLVVQARAHVEEMSRNRSRIVVTELPYQTDKSRLLERIAELVRDGRIEGITDLRDESDRTGMRICIEMTRTVDPRQVLADLYKYTPLQSTFGVSLLALVDGEPRLLSLKKMLLHFIEHRQQVILRRTRHDLAKARERAHILEGLLRALDVLDEIIALIRGSRTADIARQGLIREFSFSQAQAQAILDMQLRRLAALERQKLQDEYKQIQKLIKELEALLDSPKKVLALIKENLADLKARYGDARRTQIADRAKAVLTARDHTVERDVWVAVTGEGKLAAYSRDSEEKLPLPVRPPAKAPLFLLPANTRQDLYVFTESGRAARVPGHQLPDAPGTALSDLIGLKEPVAAMLALLPPEGDVEIAGYVLLGTVQGKIKRISLADLLSQAHTAPQVIALDEGDRLLWAGVSDGEGDAFLFTAAGQAIRFPEEEVRCMGLPAGGIGGVKLREADRVVAGFALGKQHISTHVGIVTFAGGFVKQVPIVDFPAQGRFGMGVMAASLSPRSGNVAGAALLGPRDLLVCLSPGGKTQFMRADAIPAMARASQGKSLLLKDATVERVYSLPAPEAEPAGQGPANGSSPGRGAVERQVPVSNGHKKRSTPGGPDGNGHEKAAGALKRSKVGARAGAASPGKKQQSQEVPPTQVGAGRAKAKGTPETPASAPAAKGRTTAAQPAPTTEVGAKQPSRAAGPKAAASSTAPAKPKTSARGKKSGPVAPSLPAEAPGAVAGPGTRTGGSDPLAGLEVSRTPDRVTYDRDALREAVKLPSPATPVRPGRKPQAAAEQLPLVPSESTAPATSSTNRKTSAGSGPAPVSRRGTKATGQAVASAKGAKPAATEPPALGGKAPSPSRGTTGKSGANAGSAAPPAATPPHAKHSAADGPMTWPIVPPPEEQQDDDLPMPPPKSRRPRR